jgi:hypothetical protein
MMSQTLSKVFRGNRAEEFPDDLWGTFVLPTEYHKYNLLDNDKGVKVIGGRGSGKTMYLKYHCFPTQLSSKRLNISEEDIKKIGIYWRPDTHFLQLINKNYLDSRWESIFTTYVGVSLLIKFSQFVQTLSKSNYENEELKEALSTLTISPILAEELQCDTNILYTELARYCNGIIFKLENWLHDPEIQFPIIIDGKGLLIYIINEFKNIGLLYDTTFHIFIDEFENLREEHQIIINTWIKHGEHPLIFNVAYKKYATVSNQTEGIERIERRNDVRTIDIIDDVYARTANDFKIFAAEIIVNKLQEFYKEFLLIDKDIISDIKKLPIRRTSKHKDNVLQITNHLFPEKKYLTIVTEMINDTTLYNKIYKNISKALLKKGSSILPENFINFDAPDASIVNSILLFRDRINPKDLLNTFNKYITKDKDAVKQYKDQIQNNLVGAILYIYTSFPKRICPIYAGFDRFCTMSKNNLRHLLELCYQSFIEFENNVEDLEKIQEQIPVIDINSQLKAAKLCSKQELETIAEHGEYGQRLQKIANRLGMLFRLKQRIRTQSRPENIHFSVDTLSLNSVDTKIKKLLTEAKIWNVLQEHTATKGTTEDIATKEYMLTPILAPYYQITYRKKHKIDFSPDELKTVFLESDENFEVLYNRYIKDWKVEDIEGVKFQPSLFGDPY